MTVGIPKAFLYYRYHILWDIFFKELGCTVIVSGDTDSGILKNGIKASIDENCLPLKLYLGHIHSLLDSCDYILVPRFGSFKRNEELCVRFFGLYDLVRNTYADAELLTYNLDVQNRKTELSGFMGMGRVLGKSPVRTYRAYQRAKRGQALYDRERTEAQAVRLRDTKPKVLIASQPYVIHDKFFGEPITGMIEGYGGVVIFSDMCDREECAKRSAEISNDLYWTMNKEIIGSITSHKDKVDGIIVITAFPCGADSLINELVMRKVREVPIIQLLLDEQQSQTGLQTRIESFMDILHERKKVNGA
jgi:predicted nucleotide-binding protein (sugar kinase/HSP70/actin superfamily)